MKLGWDVGWRVFLMGEVLLLWWILVVVIGVRGMYEMDLWGLRCVKVCRMVGMWGGVVGGLGW